MAVTSEQRIPVLADLFRLLGDATRLRIVLACLGEPKAVGGIADELALSASLVSHHLRLLRAARLLRAERRGKHVLYAAADAHVSRMLADMIEHVGETFTEQDPHGSGERVTGYGLIEALYGLLANSTALLADAGHNLSDVLGLLLAWGAMWLGQREPSHRFTFGLGGSSILASLSNAALLLLASGAIAWEAIRRFGHPEPVAGKTVFVVAVIGIVVNGFSAWLFARGSKDDLNLRGAFLHMLGDAAVSAAVALSGIVVLGTGWQWVDPVMSLIVVAAIVYGTWGLLAESVRLALNAVPAGVDRADIEAYLARLPGVTDVHDLHPPRRGVEPLAADPCDAGQSGERHQYRAAEMDRRLANSPADAFGLQVGGDFGGEGRERRQAAHQAGDDEQPPFRCEGGVLAK
ncbi:hypothetical protein DFQ30_009460, partial [Apophysomyces sp. BC1015]